MTREEMKKLQDEFGVEISKAIVIHDDLDVGNELRLQDACLKKDTKNIRNWLSWRNRMEMLTVIG